MRPLDQRKPIQDVMCFGLVVLISVGVLAACLAVAAMNQACLVTTSLNPFNREAVIQ